METKNLLGQIIEQDLKVVLEQQKLQELCIQYTSENRKFKDGEIVLFDQYHRVLRGMVKSAKFDVSSARIRYSIKVVKLDGSLSDQYKKFYYKTDSEISRP